MLAQLRKTGKCPDMSESLLTGMVSINKNNLASVSLLGSYLKVDQVLRANPKVFNSHSEDLKR